MCLPREPTDTTVATNTDIAISDDEIDTALTATESQNHGELSVTPTLASIDRTCVKDGTKTAHYRRQDLADLTSRDAESVLAVPPPVELLARVDAEAPSLVGLQANMGTSSENDAKQHSKTERSTNILYDNSEFLGKERQGNSQKNRLHGVKRAQPTAQRSDSRLDLECKRICKEAEDSFCIERG